MKITKTVADKEGRSDMWHPARWERSASLAPLRVLRISSRYHPPHPFLRDPTKSDLIRRFHAVGGMQLQAWRLTEALAIRGISQTVVTVKPPWESAIQINRNVEVRRFGWTLPTPRQMFALPAAVFLNSLARGSYDLVHCHSAQDLAVFPLARFAATRIQVPLIASIHCSWEHTYQSGTIYAATRRHLGTVVERWGLKHSAAVIVLTHRLRALLSGSVHPHKIRVIPDSVDLAQMRDPPPDDDVCSFIRRYGLGESPRISFVGRLVRSKGLTELIQAFAILRRRHSCATLVLAGDGPFHDELRRMVSAGSMTHSVTFTRFIHNDDVRLLLAATDVLVLPSLYEEFGSVILEGMAAGVPVVACDVSGIPSTIRNDQNGLLTRPGDAAALAVAIDRVLTDRTLTSRLTAQAAHDVETCDADRVAQRVVDEVYVPTVAQHHGCPV